MTTSQHLLFIVLMAMSRYNITTKVISSRAFYSCKSLTSISIPNSVTSIGGYAFNGCSSLKSIKIPKGLTNIGDNAFPRHTKVIHF